MKSTMIALILFLTFPLLYWLWRLDLDSLGIYKHPDYLKQQQYVSETQDVLTSHHHFNIGQLKKDWCRVKSTLISWQEIVGSCQEMSDDFMQNKKYATAPEVSQVTVHIKAAGEYTNLRIDTYSGNNLKKSIGGDSYRVLFRGEEEVVSATVFDLRNGSYDALALITKPGRYKIQVILDYTQCNGIKDPPVGWFAVAHCLKRTPVKELDYINKEVSPGRSVTIPSPKYDLKLLQTHLDGIDCGFQCHQVWDGHGSWQKTVGNRWFWKQIIPNVKRREGDIRPRDERTNRSTLYIYGDSLSMFLYQRLQLTDLCKNIFKTCANTYNWVYPKHLYQQDHSCDDKNVDVEKLRKYFKEAITRKDMDSRSVFMINLGVHLTKSVSFQKYKDIINIMIEELQNYKGAMIWKSTTAIHKQDTGRWRRYITDHRSRLFNAYVNSLICSSNLTVLNIYSLTSAYPFGTTDGIHYDNDKAFSQMEQMLIDYFR